MQQIYRRTPMPKCDFNKVENTFSKEHPWTAASDLSKLSIIRTSYVFIRLILPIIIFEAVSCAKNVYKVEHE